MFAVRIGSIARSGVLRSQVSKKTMGNFFFKSRFAKCRHYSSEVEPTSPQPPKNRGKILLLLAALAAGSSVASIFYNGKPPQSSVEPETTKSPIFKPGQIKVVFILGGPGSGKGTQCAKLVDKYSFVHLSAGDLLRAEQKRKGSEFGELIAKCIKEGTIVPQEVTLKLLENAIKENFDKGKTRFLVDGFPRKMDQALSFESQISQSSLTIFFDCPEQVMMDRILERGKSSGRTDDNVDSLKKRFKTFHETSMPVVKFFEKQNKVVKIASDRDVNEVFSDVVDVLNERKLI